jgi:hypothetical protein
MRGKNRKVDRGRRGLALTAVGALAVTGLGFVPPATASLVPGSPIPDGVNITVFHNIDFIATSGWTDGDALTIDVVRNGVVIGTAGANAITGAEGTGLEVNHGPEGIPVDGDCWEGHTPDIRPLDTIRITHPAGVSEVIVDDITFSGPAFEAPNGDILVKGVAKYADGSNIPIAALDSAEFRDTSKFRGTRWRWTRPSTEGSSSDTARTSSWTATTTAWTSPPARHRCSTVAGTQSGSVTSTHCRPSPCWLTGSTTHLVPHRAVRPPWLRSTPSRRSATPRSTRLTWRREAT